MISLRCQFSAVAARFLQSCWLATRTHALWIL